MKATGMIFKTGLATATIAATLAGHAGAATVTSSERGTLTFNAAPGEANDVSVSSTQAWRKFIRCDPINPLDPFRWRGCYDYWYEVTYAVVRDAGAVLNAGAGCSSSDPHTAQCEWPSRGSISLGDGGDAISGAPFTTSVDAGSGKDKVAGGSSGETINAADGERDAITCGGSHDAVNADGRDQVGRDCESVTRSS